MRPRFHVEQLPSAREINPPDLDGAECSTWNTANRSLAEQGEAALQRLDKWHCPVELERMKHVAGGLRSDRPAEE